MEAQTNFSHQYMGMEMPLAQLKEKRVTSFIVMFVNQKMRVDVDQSLNFQQILSHVRAKINVSRS